MIEALTKHFSLLTPYKRIFIGYSGGLDSTVLLHLLAVEPTLKNKLTAVHINHQLHAHANQWDEHCKKTALRLHIPFQSFSIQLQKTKQQSLEEDARIARYNIFDSLLSEDDCLVLAHHQIDQAETVLLQLLRGAGTQGLCGMPLIRHKNKKAIIRPLLPFKKSCLEQYANHQSLSWIEDPSNINHEYNRNFIRHEILPKLDTIFPNASKRIYRSSMLTQESLLALDELVSPHYQACLDEKRLLKLHTLLQFSPEIQRIIIRKWLNSYEIKMPNSKRLNTFLTQLKHSKEDKNPILAWPAGVIMRYQNKLYYQPRNSVLPTPSFDCPIPWAAPTEPLRLPDGLGTLKLVKKKSDNRFYIPPESQISILFRKGGERIYFNNYHQKLKKLFQMWSVPPWKRDKIPLIYINNELAAIPGYCISQHFDKSDPDSYHLSFIS